MGGFDIFAVDMGPRRHRGLEPLLVLHGFPTCSFDFRYVAEELAAERQVILVDLLGFGMSEKPDLRYSIELHADLVTGLLAQMGVERLALVTHDMGDTIGGELLARQQEGSWAVHVTRRVLTNGGIYIEMASLTAGQELLLSLPDRVLDEAPDEPALARSLAETMSARSTRARQDLAGDVELISYRSGNAMLSRTIRYIEDRRRLQERYTGAIERHPAPLEVVWGAEDPIAVTKMATRLVAKRPDAVLHRLDGVGHYPMLEAPAELLSAIWGALA